MKVSRLLVLSALWMLGLGASAQDFEPRVAPTSPNPVIDEETLAQIDKTPQEFVVGEYYVIYNVGTQMYFSQGNNWGTRASVDAKHPLVVQFTLPSGKSLEDNALLLNDYCLYNKAWKNAFFDSETAIFVDRNNQGNYFWQVVPAGDKTYRLQASPANASLNPTAYPNKFVGRDESVAQDLGNNQGSRNVNLEALPLSPFIEAKAGNHVDWQFFAAPGWKEYAAQKVLFDKSEDLRIAIEKGMDAGIEDNILTNAIEVYSNLESTVEEMDAQIMAIMKAINGEVGDGATADEPVDVTADLLVNADYENGNNDGWKGDAPAVNGSALNAEFFNKNYTYFQPLQGIRNGVYSLSVRGYYRVGSTQNSYNEFPLRSNLNAKLMAQTAAGEVHFPIANIFAGAAEEDVAGSGSANINDEIFVPNTMVAAASYFDETINDNAANYDNTLFFVVTDGVANVGMRKDKTIDNDWTLFDNWTLNYYGNEADAYQLMFTSTKEAYQLPEDGYVVTRAYLEAFNSAAPAGSDAAAYVAALKNLESAYDTLTTNATLWVELDKVKSDAEGVAANDKLDPAYTAPLGEWAMSVMMLKGQAALTNAELRTLIATKKAEIEEARKHVVEPNTDVTDMLVNPDFEQGAAGWSGSPVMGSGGGNTCAEAYNRANFDIYQEVKNARKGLYRIEVQGFFRLGRPKHEGASTNSWAIWEQGKQVAPAFVYLNDVQTALQCVYNEGVAEPAEGSESIYTQSGIDAPGNGMQYPNTMEQAAQAFAADMYKSTAYGLVLNDNDPLRIGVKGSLDASSAGFDGANWAIWDNFHLIWVGYEAQYISPVLEEQAAKFEALLEKPMGKTAFETLSARLADCKNALNSEDGKQMFDALGELLKVDSLVNASISKFATLADAYAKLVDAIGANEATAGENALTVARALASEIEGFLPAHTKEDADVDGYIVKIDEAIAALRVDVNSLDGASDDDPKDATSAINNPDYDDTNDGWSGTAAARNGDFGNAEIFNKNYDYYQDLIGLPAGTYALNVQAFYRAGLAEEDYKTLDNEYANKAYIYARATVGTDTTYYAKPVTRLASGASDWTDEIVEGYTFCATDSTNATKNVDIVDDKEVVTWEGVLYKLVANTMATASDEFLNEKYMENELIVKLPENGRLRIGLMKKGLVNNDWTLFDNWTLTYFGNESSKQADAVDIDIVAVENVAAQPTVLRTEMFTLDGRRANSIQKGIMIVKTTMSNGNIVVKKIRK